MSIPMFMFGIWISTICVVGVILLCGAFAMAIYRVTQKGWRSFAIPGSQDHQFNGAQSRKPVLITGHSLSIFI